ncbi:hypothetical protein FYJ32_02235 [Bifidobacterium tsurumiense]|nr:hypothetical protein [Bifidobacterium tsurumiense]
MSEYVAQEEGFGATWRAVSKCMAQCAHIPLKGIDMTGPMNPTPQPQNPQQNNQQPVQPAPQQWQQPQAPQQPAQSTSPIQFILGMEDKTFNLGGFVVNVWSIVAYAGALVVLLGVFMPFISVWGISQSLIGGGDGWILLLLAIAACVCMSLRQHIAAVVLAALSVCMMIFEFIHAQSVVGDYSSEFFSVSVKYSAGAFFSMLGTLVLLAGAVALLVAQQYRKKNGIAPAMPIGLTQRQAGFAPQGQPMPMQQYPAQPQQGAAQPQQFKQPQQFVQAPVQQPVAPQTTAPQYAAAQSQSNQQQTPQTPQGVPQASATQPVANAAPVAAPQQAEQAPAQTPDASAHQESEETEQDA